VLRSVEPLSQRFLAGLVAGPSLGIRGLGEGPRRRGRPLFGFRGRPTAQCLAAADDNKKSRPFLAREMDGHSLQNFNEASSHTR